ncbi:MAG: NlpC/P60 family protein [Rhodobacterales bacterium]
MTLREQKIIHAARGWIGTPYRHQASVKGQGCDCLGLLRGVWREVVGDEPQRIPSYTADWSETGHEERLWAAAMRNMGKAVIDTGKGGQVVLFRMRAGHVAKHLGILARSDAGFATVIHAYSGRGVVETPMNGAWARKIVAQFKFPGRKA